MRFDFSPSEASFAGIRWIFHRPMRCLAIVAVFALLNLAATMVAVRIAGPIMADMQLAAQNEDWQAMRVVIGHPIAGLKLGLASVLGLLPAIFATAAALRAMLGVHAPGFLGFSLGRVEGLLFLGTVLLMLLALIPSLGFPLAAELINAQIPLAAGPAALVSILGSLLGLVAVIWLLVRMSLLWPALIDRGWPGFGAAFGLTRGRYWKLLGAWILTIFVFMVLMTMSFLLGALITLPMVGFTGLGAIVNPSLADFDSFVSFPHLVYLFVSGMISGAGNIGFSGMLAHVYLAATGRDPETGEILPTES